jgi:GH15 family glucan-1,4-alpha-glucosidase
MAPFQPAPGYKPIENYGVIGNFHTVALVGMDGSIDWCCLPHFDSPSVFGAILDAKKGGHFRVAATGEFRPRQFYLPDTNILLTRFMSPDGVGEVMDFMPIEENTTDDISDHHLYRMVRCVRGSVRFSLECFPAFFYGTKPHQTFQKKGCVIFQSDGMELALHSPKPLKIVERGVAGEFTLQAGEAVTFILQHLPGNGMSDAGYAPEPGEQAFDRTSRYWQHWVSRMQYHGRWREIVTRSALVLKMLTYAPTGAIVAAPTTSLPESLGGVRNWDYRYTWIRDSSFTLYALLRLGYTEEATAFMDWLQKRMKKISKEGTLQIVYGLHGEDELTERTLDHWEGYMGTRPVRIGNGAYTQPQLDIYGELMDSVYLYDKYGSPISYDLWQHLRRMLNRVCEDWKLKDKGIWEVRSGPQHFVYSKVMCWVALDRGLRLARHRSFPAEWDLWEKNRDAIYEEVMTKGWDAQQQAFVQYYGTQAMDASALIMPLVKFLSPTDPRMISTLKRIRETLVSDSLVHRYERDRGAGHQGTHGPEGTFSMCTFWYAEALARAGEVEEARWIFEKMLGYGNHLGLFAEEVGPSGQQLGNYPQAFTHLGLISAAINLDRALQKPPTGHSMLVADLFGKVRPARPTVRGPSKGDGGHQAETPKSHEILKSAN